MDRVIGASPFVGGDRGSSVTARGVFKVAKNEDRGYSWTRGEKSADVEVETSSADFEEKLRVKDRSRGLSVISATLGDIKSSQSMLLGCKGSTGVKNSMGFGGGWSSNFVFSEEGDDSLNPKSKSAKRRIVDSLTVALCLSSVLPINLSLVVVLGVEFPRARFGVGGSRVSSADKVGRCLPCVFQTIFSAFFFSINFLKSLRENNSDILGFTQRDLA